MCRKVMAAFWMTLLVISMAQAEPIHLASTQGDVAQVKTLLTENPRCVHVKDRYGRTPLHCAAEKGRQAVVEVLLARGADVNAQDHLLVETPLHQAVFGGHRAVAELLLSRGASVNAKDQDGYTALDIATGSEQREMAALLVVQGADVRTRTGSGAILLRWAARDGDVAGIQFLLKEDPEWIDARDLYGRTPLHWAVLFDHLDAVKILSNNGAE